MSGERASEGRLDALREEARSKGRVTGDGVRAAGGPVPPSPPASGEVPGYWGAPVLKPPVWTWEVPVYFFVGGLAGMAAVLALGALLTGAGLALIRACLWIATGGMLVSVLLLISDLGRPARFLNMLRVFKVRSPMSVGAWGLNLFGAGATVSAVLAQWAVGRPMEVLLLPAMVVAATMGALVATYTGVLLAATAVPAWHVHRALLPLHFGLAGLGSAAALLELLGFRIAPLHLVGLTVATLETMVGAWVELHRHGAADRALREGPPGMLLRVAGVLAGPGALALRLAGWIPWAAGAFLFGAFLGRFGWIEAGKASANDSRAALTGS